METAKTTAKPASDGSRAPEREPATKERKKRSNPTQGLLRAKKKLDEALQYLASYPELYSDVSNTRSKVLRRFVEEEESSVSQPLS